MRPLLFLAMSSAVAALALGAPSGVYAAGGDNDATGHTDSRGVDIKPGAPTDPDAPQTHLTPPLGPLTLTDAERQKIRQAVGPKNDQEEFSTSDTKPLAGFEPKVGTKLPPKLVAQALPPSVTQELPKLADFKYIKMKGQVLIVNDVSGEIVDMFPEKPPS